MSALQKLADAWLGLNYAFAGATVCRMFGHAPSWRAAVDRGITAHPVCTTCGKELK